MFRTLREPNQEEIFKRVNFWFDKGLPITDIQTLLAKMKIDRTTKEIQKLIDSKPILNGWGEPIPSDLFDSVVGYDQIKRFFLLALKSPRTINIGLVGPAGCAKTLFLEELENKLGAKMRLGGKGTSEIGLLETLERENPKILVFDEIEKSKDCLGSLLGWSWSGRIVLSKHGKHFDIRSKNKKWMVVWAANSTKKLAKELKDRFQIFEFPAYNRESFFPVCINYLQKTENCSQRLAKSIADRLCEKRNFNVREAAYIARLVAHENDPMPLLAEVMSIKDSYKHKGL